MNFNSEKSPYQEAVEKNKKDIIELLLKQPGINTNFFKFSESQNKSPVDIHMSIDSYLQFKKEPEKKCNIH